MRKSKYLHIDKCFNWLQDQIANLSKAVEQMEYYQDFGTIEWPINKIHTLPSDIQGTIDFLDGLFTNDSVYCGLNEAEDKLKKEKDIDYFFVSMHLLGHKLIHLTNPTVKDKEIYDVAFIELTCIFFASILCRKYYIINNLSLEMVKEISMAMHDVGVLEKELNIEKKWSSDDYIGACMLMLELLHETELKSYH
jgi:hypothetical protein